MDDAHIYAPEVYESLRIGVQEALGLIRTMVEGGSYMTTHLDYPSLSYFESGVPSLSTRYGSSGPVEYSAALRASPVTNRPKPSVPSWDDAVETLSQNARLCEYYGWDQSRDHPLFRADFMVEGVISSLAERCIHVSGTLEFDEGHFRSVYQEWEAGVFLPRLSFDVMVPIIFVNFEADDVRSHSGTLALERMSQPLQLARAIGLRHTNVANATVAGGASHALVLEGWSINNGTWWEVVNALSSAETFSGVFPLIERFFAALRVETACETGYSQVVLRPSNWALRWTADLPPVSTFTVREYPDRFDAHGWLRAPCHVTSAEAQAVVELCDALTAAEQNKLALACGRLNRSYLRRDEADSILDITIAMETLLADDTTSELAYRLAMRMGALAGSFAFGDYSPATVFKYCKRVYDYRSSVVHGARGSEKKRLIREHPEAEPLAAITIGLTLLRHTIKALATAPELLDAKQIDALLLRRGS